MKDSFLHTFKSFERVNPCAQVRLCAACVGVCVCARVFVLKRKKGRRKRKGKRRGTENIQNGWGKIKTQLVLSSTSFKPSGGPHRHHYLGPVPVPAVAKLE